MLSDAETAQRLPVWRALSELFLDTELAPQDYRGIADVLKSSPYSTKELHAILENEVAPAFHPNLVSVAGEWAGWQDEVLIEEISRVIQRSRRFDLGLWLSRLFFRSYVRGEWQKIEPLLN